MLSILRTPNGQAGLVFTMIGAVVALASLRYPLGTPGQMGPGFFPFWLGILLAATGCAIFVLSFRETRESMDDVDFRAVAAIISALILSAIALQKIGLVPTIMLLVAVSSLASRDFRVGRVVLTAAGLAALAWLVFIVGLDLRIPAFWS